MTLPQLRFGVAGGSVGHFGARQDGAEPSGEAWSECDLIVGARPLGRPGLRTGSIVSFGWHVFAFIWRVVATSVAVAGLGMTERGLRFAGFQTGGGSGRGPGNSKRAKRRGDAERLLMREKLRRVMRCEEGERFGPHSAETVPRDGLRVADGRLRSVESQCEAECRAKRSEAHDW